MGQEIFSGQMRLKRFLGLNLMTSDTSIDMMEASALQNVNILSHAVEQRKGSATYAANVFKDKTDAAAVGITGLYSGIIGGTRYQVGTGGDAFKVLTAGSWVDATGVITITDNDDNLCSFATFFDNGGNEVIIGAPHLAGDTRFKWTGAGNAAALAATPGDFRYPIVHMNRLWVAVDDILYISDQLDSETWDVVWNLIRFRGDGEDISGLCVFADRVVVWKPSSVHLVSGSYYADLTSQCIVTGDGCASGYTIREIESRRYGNIIAFLSSEGILKGFNGSKNLIRLGDPIKPLYDEMNQGRLDVCSAVNYRPLKQYWLTMTYGSGTAHDQIMIYDYENDYFTNEDGKPLSSNLYHIGISANAMGIFETSAEQEILITGSTAGITLRQNYGVDDGGSTPVVSKWQSGKLDMGDPTAVKLLTDLAAITTQSSETHLSMTVTTQYNSGTGSATIPTAGSLWGTMIWGTGLWSAPDTKYTRVGLTASDNETAVSGRYFIIAANHNTAAEAMRIEEIVIGASSLGQQPEYVE